MRIRNPGLKLQSHEIYTKVISIRHLYLLFCFFTLLANQSQHLHKFPITNTSNTQISKGYDFFPHRPVTLVKDKTVDNCVSNKGRDRTINPSKKTVLGLPDPDPLARGTDPDHWSHWRKESDPYPDPFSHRYGTADSDPHQNVTDPQHWIWYRYSYQCYLLWCKTKR